MRPTSRTNPPSRRFLASLLNEGMPQARDANTRRMPPHQEQAKTPNVNALRSNPAPHRGVRSFFGFTFTAASGGGPAFRCFGSAPYQGSVCPIQFTKLCVVRKTCDRDFSLMA
jgi:hypothetical protein